MRRQGVADPSKNGMLVGGPGRFRKMLGNSDGRHVRSDFLEFTAVRQWPPSPPLTRFKNYRELSFPEPAF
jgi:hypothetical protein